MGMQDDLKAAIDQNLSAEVGGRLKKRLELVEQLQAENRDYARAANGYRDTIAKQEHELERLKELGRLEAQIKQRERALEAAELRRPLDEALTKLEAEREKVKFCEGVVRTVFGSNRFNYEVRTSSCTEIEHPNKSWEDQRETQTEHGSQVVEGERQMGQISITISGSFQVPISRLFSAQAHGHAVATLEAIAFLNDVLIGETVHDLMLRREGEEPTNGWATFDRLQAEGRIKDPDVEDGTAEEAPPGSAGEGGGTPGDPSVDRPEEASQGPPGAS